MCDFFRFQLREIKKNRKRDNTYLASRKREWRNKGLCQTKHNPSNKSNPVQEQSQYFPKETPVRCEGNSSPTAVGLELNLNRMGSPSSLIKARKRDPNELSRYP